MVLSNNLCPNCFREISSESTKCSKCGFDIAGYTERESALSAFTELNNGQYIIGRMLGQGGFGITYKALDTYQKKIVAIKEYMPSDYAERHGKTVFPIPGDTKAAKIFEHGKKSYNEEIKTLYQFRNIPGIVEVISNFSENNTSYLVMEYLDGCSLKHFVKQSGGQLDVATARNLIYAAAKALSEVHSRNVLHRDISPENIYLVNNNTTVKIIDFGAARSYIENSASEKSVLLKPGFAPPEQYSRTGNQGTWTDVYALAATMYYIVSGKYAPDSMTRMQNDTLQPLDKIVPTVTASMSKAIMSAMEIDISKRTKTCQQFMDDLDKTGWTVMTTGSFSGGNVKPAASFAQVNPNPGFNAFQQNEVPKQAPPGPINQDIPVLHKPVNPVGPIQQVKPMPPAQDFYQRQQVPNYSPLTNDSFKKQTMKVFCKVTCVSGDKDHLGRSISFFPGQMISVGRGQMSGFCNFEVSLEKIVTKAHLFVDYDVSSKMFIVQDNSLNGTYTQNGQRLVKGKKTPFPSGSIVFLARDDIIIQFTAEYRYV